MVKGSVRRFFYALVRGVAYPRLRSGAILIYEYNLCGWRVNTAVAYILFDFVVPLGILVQMFVYCLLSTLYAF